MKRIDFLKSVFGASVTASLGVVTLDTPVIEQYSFNDVFEQPYNNDILYYPKKDCPLYGDIVNKIGTERIVEGFRAYLGHHYNILPIKEHYTKDDFVPFILALNSYYGKRDVFAEYDRGVFFRMIRERNTQTMYFDVFLGSSTKV
jgi:hypothetical protein